MTTFTERIERISYLQQQKNNLTPLIQTAFIAKNNAYDHFKMLESDWITLANQYETLDREEKLIEYFSSNIYKDAKLKGKKTITRAKKAASADKIKLTENQALKALKNLPKDARDKILRQFK
jgi:hypothetical protein